MLPFFYHSGVRSFISLHTFQQPRNALFSCCYCFLIIALLTIFYTLGTSLDISKAQRRIGELNDEDAAINYLPSSSETADEYFAKLLNMNILKLTDYYVLVEKQTDRSFLASISIGVAGFLLIADGFGLSFVHIPNILDITYISSASGIITEFISSIFFYLYNRTVRQMKEYHGSLIEVQNVLLSFKLVGGINDEGKRITIAEQMIGYLLNKQDGASTTRPEPEQVQGIASPRNNAQEQDSKRPAQEKHVIGTVLAESSPPDALRDRD